jgi:hypothetical protein
MRYFMLFLLLFHPAVRAEAGPVPGPDDWIFRIGVSSRTFEAGNRNDTLAALKVWADTLVKERDIRQAVQVMLYDSLGALRTAYEQNGFDAVSVTVEETMLLGMQPDFIYIHVRDRGFHVRYVLLTRGDGAVTDLADLMNRKIAFYDNHQMVLAIPWLKILLASIAGQAADRGPLNLIAVDNQSKAILQVFFRQARAALVTREALELAFELNPQLRNELAILHESQPLITSFFFFRPDWRGVARDLAEEAVLNLHITPGGQQVLTTFQSARMSRQPGSVLDSTRRFIAKYWDLSHEPPSGEAQP